MQNTLLSISLSIILAISSPLTYSSDGHDHDEEEQSTKLTKAQMQISDITVSALVPQKVNFTLFATGELKANGYTSYSVSPRVDSIVIKRHAILGQHIEKGAALVTLFSADVANAQAAYRLTLAQWERVQKLGK